MWVTKDEEECKASHRSVYTLSICNTITSRTPPFPGSFTGVCACELLPEESSNFKPLCGGKRLKNTKSQVGTFCITQHHPFRTNSRVASITRSWSFVFLAAKTIIHKRRKYLFELCSLLEDKSRYSLCLIFLLEDIIADKSQALA